MSEPVRSSKQLWGGVAFLVAVLLSFGYISIAVHQWLQDEQKAPVQVIDFAGDFTHIDVLRLEKMIRQSQPGSFFSLDVNEVYKLVESQPWVYRASVRKQWPNKLKIYLVEQTPVAYWNEDLLLNPYGDPFESDNNALPLPHLFGPGGSEKTALQGYNAMQTLLTTVGLPLRELSLSERFAWQVELENGIELNLGRKEFIDRLQRFIDLYPLLDANEKKIEYVDLRYDTGLAVGWQSNKNDNNNKES